MLLVGFVGKKGSGKTTICNHLLQSLPVSTKKMAFADTLKEMLVPLLKVYVDNPYPWLYSPDFKEKEIPSLGVTPRFLMQTLGTEWGRDIIREDFWIDVMRQRIKRIDFSVLLFDDIRFQEEVDFLMSYENYLVYEIIRPDNTIYSINDRHKSENMKLEIVNKKILYNDDIEAVVREVHNDIVNYLFGMES